jgi:hypothetical protein
MTNRPIISKESYVRLLNSDGTSINSDNKLPCDVSISSVTINDETPIRVDIFNEALTITNSELTSIDGKLGELGQNTMEASLSVVLASNHEDIEIRALTNSDVVSAEITSNKPSSSTTLWNNASSGVATASSVHTVSGPHVSIFGTVNGATTLTVWLSDDNTTYYKDINSFIASQSGDVAVHLTTACKYLHVKSSSDITTTLICSSR